MEDAKVVAIRKVNDTFRTTFLPVFGKVMMTIGFKALDAVDQSNAITLIREFKAFTEDNDPHGEHDFGAVDEAGVRCFFKIDYYDRKTEFGSPDPADPAVTTRVLTIMLADEY